MSRCTNCSCTYCKKSGEPRYFSCAFHDGFVPDDKSEIMRKYIKILKYGSAKDIAIYRHSANYKGVSFAVLDAHAQEKENKE